LAQPTAPGPIVLAPFLVSLDWLCLNMMAPPPHPMRKLPWEHLDPVRWWDELDMDTALMTHATSIRTSQFARVTYLMDERREKMATIWHEPHQANRNGEQWIQVQFANEALYTGRWATIFRMFRNIGCEYTAISRVDLACDGLEGYGGDFPAVLQLERTGQAKYYGKCEWLTRSQRARVVGGEFGSRRSNKFIRAYNKKREMKSKGIKPHVVNAWEQVLGFNPMNEPINVHRFEAQLKGKEIRRYFPEENSAAFVDKLSDQAARVELFASMAPGMFDFRTHADRARDAVPVATWDFSRVRTDAPVVAERAERNIGLSEHTIKVGLRSIAMLGMVTGDPGAHAMAEQYAKAAGEPFVNWYRMKRTQWVREFAKLAAAGDERTMEVFHRLQHPTEGTDGASSTVDGEWMQGRTLVDPLDNPF
jgi:hypothetical protein